MKPLLMILFTIFLSSHSHGTTLFLFHSTKNVDKAFLIPRDIKKRTLVISISSSCLKCALPLTDLMREFAQKDEGKTELLITINGNLWSNVVKAFQDAEWLPRSLSDMSYHDPNGRFRKQIASDDGVYLILFGPDGLQEKRERLSSTTSYSSFFSVGSK